MVKEIFRKTECYLEHRRIFERVIIVFVLVEFQTIRSILYRNVCLGNEPFERKFRDLFRGIVILRYFVDLSSRAMTVQYSC